MMMLMTRFTMTTTLETVVLPHHRPSAASAGTPANTTPLSAIEKNWTKFVFDLKIQEGIQFFTEVFSRSSFEWIRPSRRRDKERERERGSGGGARGCRRTIRWRRTLSSFQHDVFSRPGHAHRQPRAGRTDRPWGYKQVVLQDRHHRWHDTDTFREFKSFILHLKEATHGDRCRERRGFSVWKKKKKKYVTHTWHALFFEVHLVRVVGRVWIWSSSDRMLRGKERGFLYNLPSFLFEFFYSFFC